jgi:hypothetical protein
MLMVCGDNLDPNFFDDETFSNKTFLDYFFIEGNS